MDDTRAASIKTAALLFLASFFIMLQEPFAPFASKSAPYDAGVFVFVAKKMLAGALVYRDIFDHKGPLLYLFNMLGLTVSRGSVTGIWVVDLLCLSVSSLLMYRTARLFGGRFSALLSVLYALFLLSVLEPGDGTQFYALPFLNLTLYLTSRRLKQGEEMRVFEIAAMAFSFAAVLLLQPNLVAIWCVFAIVESCRLIGRGRWQAWLSMAGISLISMAAVLLPFAWYARSKGIWEAAISCYWTFNRTYAHPSATTVAAGIYNTLVNIDKGHAVVPVACYLAYLAVRRRSLSGLTVHLYLAACLVLSLLLGCTLAENYYPHYAIVLVPEICCIAAFCLERLRQEYRFAPAALVVLVAVFSWRPLVLQLQEIRRSYRPDTETARLVEFIKRNTSEGDRISVLGNDSQLYYLSGRDTGSRFHYTAPIFGIPGNQAMPRSYRADLLENRPRLIVVKTGDYPQIPEFVAGILARQYRRLDFASASASVFLLRDAG